MSEPKLISPLLDGFAMGEALSSHDGVSCYPAMKENSEDKYIVKIISVPASQKQLDALLLTGAFADAAAAADYFKEQADDVVKEAKLLKQLAKLEGFLSYEGWQIAPMEDNNLGYDIYLVGAYKRSLDKYLRRNTMTHLGAVNLGLDLCAALSVLRRAGFMHVDLKPSNIFLSGEREYRIGDLGFVKLNSLKYSSLPSKYISRYTPPELHDPMSTLNPTADIYAVGLILYQIYNNGVLPFEAQAPGEELPAPMNADYELAEIILKACHPNPRHRWQTPIEMGQALVSYMQRNSVNDIPILPPVAEPVSEEAEPVENSASDETAPSAENVDGLSDTKPTEEVSAMLTHADDLIAPEASSDPEEEPESDDDGDDDEDDEDDEEEENTDHGKNSMPVLGEDEDDDEDEYDDDDEDEIIVNDGPVGIDDSLRKKRRGRVALILVVLLLALACGGAWYYYTNYYLLPIENMEIDTFEDTITVSLTTEADETLLRVVCTDAYGNAAEQRVENGQAVFTDLNPDTTYEISVVADGFHKTSNSCIGTCSTDKQTVLSDFTAITGAEEGSVILSFTVTGPEIQDWIVEYSAEGEQTRSVSFTGHMVTIGELTLDKTYSFDLIAATSTEQWIVGTTALEYTATKIVVAENVTVTSVENGVLTAKWDAPADSNVSGWSVRCYSQSGYDQTMTVTDTTAQFTDIDPAQAHTIDVTAIGMTQSARGYISANPTKITAIQVDDSAEDRLTVTWSYEGGTPTGGWLLMYSLDGGKNTDVVKCAEASGVIPLRIPKAVYSLTIQAVDGSSVFGGSQEYTCPDAEAFDLNYLTAADIMASFCHTPGKDDWTYDDVDEYPSTYTAADKVSMVLYATKNVSDYSEEIEITYIFRDEDGNVLLDLMATEKADWLSLWNGRYAYLNLPGIPDEAGEYTVDLYFNGGFAISKKITVTE